MSSTPSYGIEHPLSHRPDVGGDLGRHRRAPTQDLCRRCRATTQSHGNTSARQRPAPAQPREADAWEEVPIVTWSLLLCAASPWRIKLFCPDKTIVARFSSSLAFSLDQVEQRAGARIRAVELSLVAPD